jgi:hypothetical protein
LFWSLEPAKGGDIQAMYLASARYEKAIGTSRNVDEARRWYRQAAEYAAGGDDSIREERIVSWRRDAQKALERLDAEVAAEKAVEAARQEAEKADAASGGDAPTAPEQKK